MCFQSVGVSVEVTAMGDGSDTAVTDALSAVERNNGWLVIEHFELTPPDFLKEFRHSLQTMASRRSMGK